MSDWEIVGAAMTLIGERAVAVLGVAGIVGVPLRLVVDPWGARLGFGWGWIPTTLARLLSDAIAGAAITYLICEARLRRGTTIRDGLLVALKRLGAVLGTALLCFSGVVISVVTAFLLARRVVDALGGEPSFKLTMMMLMFGIGGLVTLYVGALLAFSNQAIVLEGQWGAGALRRSATLAYGDSWRVIVVLGTASLLLGALGWVLDLVLAVVPPVASLGRYGVEIVGSAFVSTALTLLYVDLRHRKEGFDLAQLEQSVSPLVPEG
jgi:hypothetical protein